MISDGSCDTGVMMLKIAFYFTLINNVLKCILPSVLLCIFGEIKRLISKTLKNLNVSKLPNNGISGIIE